MNIHQGTWVNCLATIAIQIICPYIFLIVVKHRRNVACVIDACRWKIDENACCLVDGSTEIRSYISLITDVGEGGSWKYRTFVWSGPGSYLIKLGQFRLWIKDGLYHFVTCRRPLALRYVTPTYYKFVSVGTQNCWQDNILAPKPWVQWSSLMMHIPPNSIKYRSWIICITFTLFIWQVFVEHKTYSYIAIWWKYWANMQIKFIQLSLMFRNV